MKTYRVYFQQVEVSYIEVEANDANEANDLAQIEWAGGDDGEYVSSEVETIKTEEV